MASAGSGVVRRRAAWVLLWSAWAAWAESENPNTDWFRDARYGVFMHFLPGDAQGLARVAEFDVAALAGQLEAMGARYFVLTLGQNSGYFNAPNAAYDRRTGYAAGERCAVRDLPLALWEALAPKGIRLMLYLPCQTPNQDRRAQKAFGLREGPADQPIDLAFARKWAEVIQEWSDRYGEKVAGWWFDGAYAHVRFNEEIAQVYAQAVKHGNPRAIVTFNPGVKVIRWTHAEDYTAGELNEPFDSIPAARRLEGSQWHALTFLCSSWSGRETRYPAGRWASWVAAVVAKEGVVTLDMGPNWDPRAGPIGALAEEQVAQVNAIKARVARIAPVRSASPGGRLPLESGWRLKSSVLVPESDAIVSSIGYRTDDWLSTGVPSTVLSALVANAVYPDPRIGLNAYLIPDSSDEFNAAHDLARYSYLPQQRNPWRDPYWYRTELELPPRRPDARMWLAFDAINYRAEVWVNGTRVADRTTMAGMFRRFRLDVTDVVHTGRNALAVKVFPVDHPGTPDTQWEVLGPERGYHKELERDVTEIMTIGYDCMMTVPDRNMGLWQGVSLRTTGPVTVRDPFVRTHLPLPDTSRAELAISAEFANTAAVRVSGVLRGSIAGTDVRFEQTVTLNAGETRVITIVPAPVLAQPRLWWPAGYGEQHLYELTLRFETAQGVSDEERVAFGVREVAREIDEIDGWHGRRVFVNGRRIFCRGGYIQPELMFDWDPRRMDAEIRYYAAANLNLIYFEDIPNPPAPFLELCDRYGVMFGSCHYSCHWLRPGTPYPDDFELLERCTVDTIKRYRNHPSLIMYMAMNEGDTKEDVYAMWRRHVLALDGTRWFIPSATFPSDRANVPAWLLKDLPAGMTDVGASYSWAEPAAYFNRVRERRNWRFMMEGGSASLPPVSSLARFIPDLQNAPPGPHFPLTKTWAHHGANHYYKGYDEALRRLHGEPANVVEYCWKGHLVTADQHRSMFEAVNHRMWDVTSGVTQWKINACEPSVQWQIFDWYLKPMVSWAYIRNACEPLHVQLNLPDRMVSVINVPAAARDGLVVRARIMGLDGKVRWEKTATTGVAASAYREVFALPEAPEAGPIELVRLDLAGAGGTALSRNFYWLPAKDVGDLKALEALPPVRLQTAFTSETRGEETIVRANVANPNDGVAFFIQLAVTKGAGGAEALPVLWDDNYFSLLPHETREIAARIATRDLDGAGPVVEVGGWNVQTPYECERLALSSTDVKAGEELTVSAAVAHTFLDGSRVALLLDGAPVAYAWAWARGAEKADVTFAVRIDKSGTHELRVGEKRASLAVK